MEERIVSAANRSPEGLVVMCVRHGCDLFFGVVDQMFDEDNCYLDWEQGFVTNKYRFVSREEAWIIAEKQGQIIRDHDLCIGTLYSEHLYWWGVIMFYFMCFITFICVFNLLIMGFITWKFGIDVFFMNDEEPSKEYPLNRSQWWF